MENLNNTKFEKTRRRKRKLTKRDAYIIVETASQQEISPKAIKKSLDFFVAAFAVCRVKDSKNLQYSKCKLALDLKASHKEKIMKFAEEKIFWKK